VDKYGWQQKNLLIFAGRWGLLFLDIDGVFLSLAPDEFVLLNYGSFSSCLRRKP